MENEEDLHAATSDLLQEFGRSGEAVSIGQMVDALGERAFGVLLVILALPVAIPALYGIPQIVSVPMLLLSAQIALGRRALWLPESVLRREIGAETFASLVKRTTPLLRWFEKVAHPRLSFLTHGIFAQLAGLLMAGYCISILIPLPGTNTVPGIGVGIAALGLIERDGLLTFVGLLIGAVWVALLAVLGVEGIRLLIEQLT
ncbi:MAG: exopolysaccharide biosynthesis protein [Alphaproteobacteria bacterium]